MAKGRMRQDWDGQNRANIEKYIRQVKSLFNKMADEASLIGSTVDTVNPDRPFSFADYPATKKRADKLISTLQNDLDTIIVNGVRSSWTLSNNKNNELARQVFGNNVGKLSKAQYRRYFSNNGVALDEFIKRKESGLNLSDRVWRYSQQFKKEIEMGLDLGIGNGLSADQMARDLKQYLQFPDKLFRRVRDKHGELQLSKAAQAFHPGAGVYRSSYKNAMRLSRTENNMAYKASDHERWNEFDFVVGLEIKLSNNPNHCPVCEALAGKYPKTFKFVGWHPQCRCAILPILKNVDELKIETENILAGRPVSTESANEITEMPQGFKKWFSDNKGRLSRAKSVPYWLRDNAGVVNGAPFKKEVQGKRAKTNEERKAVQSKWNSRATGKIYSTHLSELEAKYGSEAPSLMKTIKDARDSIKRGLPQPMVRQLVDKVEKRVAIKQAWDERAENNALSTLLVDVKELKADFGKKKVFELYASVEAKIESWKYLPVDKQIEKAKYEIDWVTQHKKYDTWIGAKKAYQKYLETLKIKKLGLDIDKAIFQAKAMKPATSSKLYKLTKKVEYSQSYLDEVKAETENLFNNRIKRARWNKKPAADASALTDAEIEQLIKDFNKLNRADADALYRQQTIEVWATLTDAERRVLTKYTQTYHYLNEPLRGIPYHGDVPKNDYDRDMPLLTSVIAKFKTQKNMVVRRGVDNWDIKELGYNLDNLKVGDEFGDNAFLSAAVEKTGGFTHPEFDFRIIVPKGMEGVYAEPFSHYTDGLIFDHLGKIWDGVTEETIRSEMEWLGQRGSRFRVLKKKGNQITLLLLRQER